MCWHCACGRSPSSAGRYAAVLRRRFWRAPCTFADSTFPTAVCFPPLRSPSTCLTRAQLLKSASSRFACATPTARDDACGVARKQLSRKSPSEVLDSAFEQPFAMAAQAAPDVLSKLNENSALMVLGCLVHMADQGSVEPLLAQK